MLVSTPPKPNPKLIAWARHEAGYDVQRVAKRLAVKPKQVAGWEGTGKPPTVRQLMNLAAFLQRPLGLFFQEELPRVTPLAAEYRHLPTVVPGQESPELRLAIRHMLARRENALDLIEELGDDVPDFTLRAHLSEDPCQVGGRLRDRIGITTSQQGEFRDGWQAWREWRSAIEGIGVLVFMFPRVHMDEVRGISLLRTPLPVAAVNTKEVTESRAYTALHEVVHLMLVMAKEESSALDDRRSAEELQALERFAEVAASHALVPEDALADAVGGNPPTDVDGMRSLAGRFKITPLAAATRLRESGYLTWTQYNAWRDLWNAYLEQFPPRKGGFATPVSKTLGRGGRMFAQLVLEAFDTHRITTADAARYLDLRPDHFDKLRQRLVAGSSAETPDE
jgi:Zn-dependent peptidase ImmA (M78 family)/transcriptional regulator with XRE-family HTH domain